MPLPAGHVPTADELAALYNEDTFDGLGTCSLSTTSASYVDITGASKSWTKILSSSASDVIVHVSLSCYTATATSTVKIGVNINGTDTDAILFQYSSANIRTTLPDGHVRISGLAAGSYTVKLRALRSAGTGTVTIDLNDTVSFRVEEKVL